MYLYKIGNKNFSLPLKIFVDSWNSKGDQVPVLLHIYYIYI